MNEKRKKELYFYSIFIGAVVILFILIRGIPGLRKRKKTPVTGTGEKITSSGEAVVLQPEWREVTKPYETGGI